VSARRAGRRSADPPIQVGNATLTGDDVTDEPTVRPEPGAVEEWDDILDAVTVGVVIHAGDGSLMVANSAARGMLTGLPTTMLAHAVSPVAENRNGPRTFSLNTPRPDGTARRLVATAVPLTHPLAEPGPSVVTTLRDLAVEQRQLPATLPGATDGAASDHAGGGRPRPEEDSAELRHSLAMAERRLRATVDTSPLGSALLTPHGRLLQVNRALARMLGRDPTDLTGVGLAEITHPADQVRESPLVERLLARSIGSYELEKRFQRPGGENVWARVTMTPVCEDDGSVLHLVMQAQDVTETRLAVEMLTHHAMHDQLTGLSNRATCLGRIQRALDKAARQGMSARQVAVLCCDLDDFRVVNDSVGPSSGDAVLIEVANRLRGDEFVVVAEDLTETGDAVALAQRVLGALRRPVEVGGHSIVPTASVGIAMAVPGGDAMSLLRDAGTALHAAKRHGRGSWQLMDEDLRRRTVDRLDIESQLRTGLAVGQLRLHVQPIVDLSDGTVVGREALVRWQHPDLGLLPPARFLPVAEETGLIEDLGRWVIGEATRIASATPDLGYVAINISPSQVHRTHLVDDVQAALDASGLPPSRLVVELTESVMLGAAPQGRSQLQQLDDLGVRLVVDDFGTGFSALSHLRDLPVSGIKVDRSFTQGLGQDTHCERIVEALTGLAQGLGVDIVAEGVETENQAQRLVDIGCQHAQGYLFGRPEPAFRE
jgi:diguanylate cyclase (GGDEF)-like protein/PAS domain S-box-containing protein